jgi:hypothetical protein
MCSREYYVLDCLVLTSGIES